MANGFSGRLLILSIGDGASTEVFTAIAGLRDTTITESNETVDVTSKDDAGIRCLLGGLNGKAITVTGTGVFKDDATVASIRADLRAGTLRNFEIDKADTGATTGGEVITAAFQITSFEEAGAYDGEMNYSITLESSGAVTVA